MPFPSESIRPAVHPALRRLAALLPPDRLLCEQAELAAYESDGLTAYKARPLAIAVPETQEEVIEIVRSCRAENLPFVARGSGTSLSGGSLPVAGGIVIALNRLKRILKLDPELRLAVVEPGVINTQVSVAAAPHGLHYAPDPSSQTICTIGGNIAFNSGGAHCLKYGMTSNHVLGIKAVLGTGEVVQWGGPSREQVGPDWCGLFVGNEGLFGIALEVTLQLLPKSECFHTVLAGYRTLEQAGDAVSAIVASGLLPGAIEIMDALALEAAVAAVHADYPPGCEAVLIVELEGPREVVAAERVRLDQVLAGSDSVGVRVARDAEERQAIWKGRKCAFSAVGRLSPDFIVQDGVVPRRRLGEALRRIGELARAAGVRCANVFHAGDGNLHPLILYDGREPGALARAEGLAGQILNMCVEMGGSITGEHGVGHGEARVPLPDVRPGRDRVHAAPARRLRSPRHRQPGQDVPLRGGAGAGVARASSAGKVRRPEPRMTSAPETLAELGEAVRAAPRVVAIGGGTKPRLSAAPADVARIELRRLSGVVEYDPAEFTFTALAGTPVRDIAAALAAKGQYLPFDPMLVAAGSTLGGTVASGVSGPGRFRFGGLRDFILGVRFVDGTGRLLRMGGKVVKNAAGFDVPKFFVGSVGRYGVLGEITFKVFPRPEAAITLRLPAAGPAALARTLVEMSATRWEPDALDVAPGADSVHVRFAAPRAALEGIAGDVLSSRPGERLASDEAEAFWSGLCEFRWAHPGGVLIKVAMSPRDLPALFSALLPSPGPRVHVTAGGNAAFVSLSGVGEVPRVSEALSRMGLPAVTLWGEAPLWIGAKDRPQLAGAVKQALDPVNRFPPIDT